MGESTVRTKSKSKSSSRNTSSNSGSAVHHSHNLSSFYSAGPALSLIQRNVTIGKSGDPYEKEADAVSKKVVAGESVPQISRMPEGAIGREEIKKPEETAIPIQKEEIKKPEEAAKVVQKEELKKPEETVKAVQKEEIKKPEEATKAIQKEEIKKSEETAKVIQKEEIKKPEETAKPIQKEELKKPEEATKTLQKQDDETAQAKEGSNGSKSSSMENAASHAINTKGLGQPLSQSTQDSLESKMGTDFSNVRVHNDSAANEAASALNARAFTHKNDIWLGKGESQNDLCLMAHEATHVVQQSDAIQRMVQQKKDGDGNSSAGAKGAEDKKKKTEAKKEDPGDIDVDKNIITYKKLRLPAFKAIKEQYSIHKKDLKRAKGYDRKKRDPKQHTAWNNDTKMIEKTLREKIIECLKLPDGSDYSNKTYDLEHTDSSYHLLGKVDEMVENAKLPAWDRHGKPNPKDIDHVVELQISGWGGTNSENVEWPLKAGETGNLELMDSRANQDSGNAISKEIDRKIDASIEIWPGDKEKDPKKKKTMQPPDRDTIKEKYDLVFDSVDEGLDQKGDPENNHWKYKEISKGEHLVKFKPPKKDSKNANQWLIFPTDSGGEAKAVKPGDEDPASNEKEWLSPFYIKKKYLKNLGDVGKEIGNLTIDINATDDEKKCLKMENPRTITIMRHPTLSYAAYLNKSDILNIWRHAKLKGMSPISISSWDILPDKGFIAYGTILSDIQLFQGTSIDFSIEGKKIEFRKLFDTGELSFPKPIRVTSSILEVYAGTAGVGVQGEALFEIEKIGNGRIGAGAGITLGGEGSFAIDGEFNFDTELFDKANVQVWYRKNKFGGKGELEIQKKGKVRGIRYAHATVSIEDGKIDAKGTVKPDVPGVEQGDMQLIYSESEGLLIAGSLQFKKIKGLKGGKLDAKVVKKGGEENYRLSAQGQLESDIPGINATLNATYDDGAFDANVTTAYEKGMLKGTVTAGATNRPMNKDGQPDGAPGKHSDNITIYGGGTATVRLAPWLQGTAGMRLLPNGEVEMVGAIGLPDVLELFPQKILEKPIPPRIGTDIPIIGFAVAGQRVGLFANISGSLDLSAGIGPGHLQELGLAVKYNPSREEETHIKGGAKLFIPARAGIRLSVRGALGAGVPIVSAQAGLEIGGALGIEAAISAAVQVDWTPAKGLVFDSLAEASAEPKFRFNITGFLLVEANLLLKSWELYNKRWELAAVEYGSGLRFGIKLPVNYEEKKPFDISMDKIQFEVPHIEPKQICEGLVKSIV